MSDVLSTPSTFKAPKVQTLQAVKPDAEDNFGVDVEPYEAEPKYTLPDLSKSVDEWAKMYSLSETVEKSAPQPASSKGRHFIIKKTVERDADKRISAVIEEHIEVND